MLEVLHGAMNPTKEPLFSRV